MIIAKMTTMILKILTKMVNLRPKRVRTVVRKCFQKKKKKKIKNMVVNITRGRV
jgi:hypothetical protein